MHHHVDHYSPARPAIAIVIANTLSSIGLASIFRRMMPSADIATYSSTAALLHSPNPDHYYHFFVTAEQLLVATTFFLARQSRTIVLLQGPEALQLPQGFHQLNVQQEESLLIKDIIRLAHTSHTTKGSEPEAVRIAKGCPSAPLSPQLTAREQEVLQGIVCGMINKEIAHRLGVSISTIITHRNHLTAKLGTRNVASLTLYAVTHGIVRSEDLQ